MINGKSMYEKDRVRVNTKEDGRSMKAIMTTPPLTAEQHQAIRNKQVNNRRKIEDMKGRKNEEFA